MLNTQETKDNVWNNQSPKSQRSSATQSQKFNGNNNLNNKVTVDYNKKTVDFEPLLVESTFYMFFISWLGAFLVAIYGVTLSALIVAPFAQYYVGTTEHLVILAYILIILLSLLCTAFYFNKRFVKEVFPKFNYGNVQVGSFFCALKKRTIEPEAVVNNTVVIPSFKNVYIGYETSGDFDKYLEKVEIKNIFKEDAFLWFVVFTFKETPKNGVIKVEYV